MHFNVKLLNITELNPISVALNSYSVHVEVLLLLPGRASVSPSQGYLLTGTHLYTWVMRDNVEQSFLS